LRLVAHARNVSALTPGRCATVATRWEAGAATGPPTTASAARPALLTCTRSPWRSRLVVVLRRDAKIELLKRVPLFAECSKKELGEIALLADEIDVGAGKVLTREGDSGREFFVLVEGGAEVRRKGRKISTMNSGDFFGEIALVSKRPRTATVTTASPARLLVVTDRAFRQLMEKMPSIQLKVLAALADRMPADAL
jgi:CRP/FNR family cyclic AMP-dependent transcriptional regulator